MKSHTASDSNDPLLRFHVLEPGLVERIHKLSLRVLAETGILLNCRREALCCIPAT